MPKYVRYNDSENMFSWTFSEFHAHIKQCIYIVHHSLISQILLWDVTFHFADFDSLLTTLKSLGEGEGRSGREEREDGKGLRLLEQMLHSKTFKRAQKVHNTNNNNVDILLFCT